MQWRNQTDRWGMTAVVLHWLVAMLVFGLFALGWWMTDLGYYDSWYQRAPFIHKSIGLLLVLVVLARLLWRQFDAPPEPLLSHAKWEKVSAKWVHGLLYTVLLVIFISGYLISTADGRAISVFGWFEVPATLQSIDEQEDVAGLWHWYAACSLMALVAVHALGALKHQFIDKDRTLVRMFGRSTAADKTT